MSNETTLAYIAGVFDGEGCVSPYLSKSKKRNKVYESTVLRIIVTNTSLSLLKLIQDVFRVGNIREKKSKLGKKKCWVWYASSVQAAYVLKSILPYLTIKKQQAELGLRIAYLVSGKQGCRRIEKDFRECVALIEQVKELKRLYV